MSLKNGGVLLLILLGMYCSIYYTIYNCALKVGYCTIWPKLFVYLYVNTTIVSNFKMFCPVLSRHISSVHILCTCMYVHQASIHSFYIINVDGGVKMHQNKDKQLIV